MRREYHPRLVFIQHQRERLSTAAAAEATAVLLWVLDLFFVPPFSFFFYVQHQQCLYMSPFCLYLRTPT